MSVLEVVEKFVSINGEGTKAGQLAVFIRFKGCNLNCKYCDTTPNCYKRENNGQSKRTYVHGSAPPFLRHIFRYVRTHRITGKH